MSIHFDYHPTTPSTHEAYHVRCDELPGASLGFIYLLYEGCFVYQTESYNIYGKACRSRRGRRCDSLESAKAAAVSYVTRKLKQAKDEQEVRHGHGFYFKSRTRWFYAYEVDGTATSPQPATSKKDAKERLLTVPAWATAAVKS
jgi:hypothetical protein